MNSTDSSIPKDQEKIRFVQVIKLNKNKFDRKCIPHGRIWNRISKSSDDSKHTNNSRSGRLVSSFKLAFKQYSLWLKYSSSCKTSPFCEANICKMSLIQFYSQKYSVKIYMSYLIFICNVKFLARSMIDVRKMFIQFYSFRLIIFIENCIF